MDTVSINATLWQRLEANKTMMVTILRDAQADLAYPMIAQVASDQGDGPVWCFTHYEHPLAIELSNQPVAAQATFAEHRLFISLAGRLSVERRQGH
jgi:hypothetical protein